MTLGRIGVITFCLMVGVARAEAQAVKVEFLNGSVTLTAQNATPRQILAEWARVGGTRIVNGDRVPGTPMTIELVGVSERQALDVILRSASGYMAAARTSGAGTSGFDRVHILPTSTATQARPGAAPAAGQPARALPIQQQPAPAEGFDNDPPEPGNPQGGNPGRLVPCIGGRPGGNPPFPSAPNVPEPDDADDIDADDAEPDDDQPVTRTPTPSNPFGTMPGSMRPGVVNPPPRQPGQPNPSPGSGMRTGQPIP